MGLEITETSKILLIFKDNAVIIEQISAHCTISAHKEWQKI
jgi:hypothetical protein